MLYKSFLFRIYYSGGRGNSNTVPLCEGNTRSIRARFIEDSRLNNFEFYPYDNNVTGCKLDLKFTVERGANVEQLQNIALQEIVENKIKDS